MAAHDQMVTILSEDECWNLLSSVSLGRLVTVLDGRPEIFPVNFVVQRRTVLFRTAEGTKLLSLVMDSHVAFEADAHGSAAGWSVIIKGEAQPVETRAGIEEADRAHLLSWTGFVKLRYVRVHASEISGRRFRFDAPVDGDSLLP